MPTSTIGALSRNDIPVRRSVRDTGLILEREGTFECL
jgi:hypothetical protein